MKIVTKKRTFEDQSFRLKVQMGALNSSFSVHSHEFMEIVVVFEGWAVHRHDKETYPLTAGDVCVIYGTHTHSFDSAHNLIFANVMCDPRQFLSPFPSLKSIPGYHRLFGRSKGDNLRAMRLSHSNTLHVRNSIEKMEKEQGAQANGYHAALHVMFLEMIVFISRACSEVKLDENNMDARSSISPVLSVIEKNYADKEATRIEYLAEQSGMPYRTFYEVFRTATGCSPCEYLMSVRLSHAADLLLNTTFSIREIATMTGFSDANYFSRCYKKHMKCTPRMYRKMQVQ